MEPRVPTGGLLPSWEKVGEARMRGSPANRSHSQHRFPSPAWGFEPAAGKITPVA